MFSNSEWVHTGVKCSRCDNDIVQEALSDGRLTDHFTCRRLGCTWADYSNNVDKVKEEMNLTNTPLVELSDDLSTK